jgi:hypothetical protein
MWRYPDIVWVDEQIVIRRVGVIEGISIGKLEHG